MDLNKITSYFEKMYKDHSKNIKELMNQVGFDNISDTQLRMTTTQIDPDGNRWKPNSPKYAEYKKRVWKSDKIWVRSGNTLKNIKSTVFGGTGGYGVSIGTNIPYAKRVHYGFGNLPERPLFGFDQNRLDNIVDKYFDLWRK